MVAAPARPGHVLFCADTFEMFEALSSGTAAQGAVEAAGPVAGRAGRGPLLRKPSYAQAFLGFIVIPAAPELKARSGSRARAVPRLGGGSRRARSELPDSRDDAKPLMSQSRVNPLAPRVCVTRSVETASGRPGPAARRSRSRIGPAKLLDRIDRVPQGHRDKLD